MKPCVILLLLLPAALRSVAQEPALNDLLKKRQLLEQYKYRLDERNVGAIVTPLQDSLRGRLYRQLLSQQGLVKATYSHSTPRGKVYTLTPDHMPCLVPERKAVAPMPNKKELFVEDNINRLPVRPIIPQSDSSNRR